MQTDMGFLNKVAIVTGTTGIGKAIAMRFARGGAQVLSCGIDDTANAELAQEAEALGTNIQVRKVDVSLIDEVQGAVAAAIKVFGGLDIIVNAAAILPYGTAIETDLDTWSRCLNVNVTSIFLFAHFGIPEMKKRGGGAIVNLASVQGYACQRRVVAYATSKAAVHSLTRALALDHASDQIRVNSISPGSIRTPMLERAARILSPELTLEQAFMNYGAAHALGRIGTAEEVAELAAFLASDKASFCTGADYVVDGGLIAGVAV